MRSTKLGLFSGIATVPMFYINRMYERRALVLTHAIIGPNYRNATPDNVNLRDRLYKTDTVICLLRQIIQKKPIPQKTDDFTQAELNNLYKIVVAQALLAHQISIIIRFYRRLELGAPESESQNPVLRALCSREIGLDPTVRELTAKLDAISVFGPVLR